MLFIIYFVIALISMLFLLYLNINFIGAFVITLLILLIFNYIGGYIISERQSNALNSDCDPERYLEMIDKQEKRFRKKPRIINILAINRAAAHILLGDFATAKEYLDGINVSYLSEKNGTYLIYTINLISCYYALGEIEKAEALYETNLVRLCPFGKRVKITVEILIGERYYYLQKYDLSYEHLKKQLSIDLNKRQYLGILFTLAQMDMINGATEQAIVKFKKIAKLGNKLWIAKASQEMLDKMQLSEQ